MIQISLGFSLFVLLFPMLATSPQNPDGAEMMMAALSGGVLHPPGYPVQVWLNQLFIHLPFGNAAYRLSLFSLIAHVGATLLILNGLLATGVSRVSAVTGGLLFCFFPVAWYLGVQPEKYALTALLVALMIWLFIQECQSDGTPGGSAGRALGHNVLIGAVYGVAFAQHPALIVMAPLFAMHLICLWNNTDRSWKPVATVIFTCGCSILGLYFSLFLATSAQAWPDWGKIQSAQDLLHLFLRKDFRVFSLQPNVEHHGPANVALFIFAENYWDFLRVLVALPIAGLYFLFRRDRKFWGLTFTATILTNILFLWFARIAPANLPTEGYLERYCIPLVVVLSFLCGIGVSGLIELTQLKLKPLMRMAFLILPVLLFLSGYDRANASHEDALDLYREGISLSNDPNAVYFAGTDLEFFYGLNTPTGIRFPIIADFGWAITRLIPLVEPRLHTQFQFRFQNSSELAKQLYESDQRMMISVPTQFKTFPSPVIQKGLMGFIQRSQTNPLSSETLNGAVQLCDVVLKINRPIPTRGFHYARYLLSAFPESYRSTEQYLRSMGDTVGADLSQKIALTLAEGSTPQYWLEGCQQFKARYSRNDH